MPFSEITLVQPKPFPNRGIGLVEDKRAIDSATRALSVIQILVGRGAAQKFKTKEAISQAAQRYWSDHDHDNQVGYAEIKRKTKNVLGLAKRMSSAVKNVENHTKVAINSRINRLKHALFDKTDYLFEISEALLMLEAALQSIAAPKYKKSAQKRVINCCEVLWELRETLEKRPFVRQLEMVRGKAGYEFVHSDAHFAAEIMRAVDPMVTARQVRSALQRLAKAAPKRSKK